MVIYDENKEAEFDYDWLSKAKYQFKLLALLAVLADNHLAYRGTLADMCEFLGVASRNSRTDKRIRDAIDALEKDGLLKKIEDGNTFTLTLSKKAEKQRRVIRIKNEWVMIAKNYTNNPNKSENVSWETVLRVWLFLIDYCQFYDEPITDKYIAKKLHMAPTTVSAARRALENDIDAIIRKRIVVHDLEANLYCCFGSEIKVAAWVTEDRQEP